MNKWAAPELKRLYNKVIKDQPKSLRDLLYKCHSFSNITIKNDNGLFHITPSFDLDLFKSNLHLFYKEDKDKEKVYKFVYEIVLDINKEVINEIANKLQYKEYIEFQTLEVIKCIYRDCIRKYIMKNGLFDHGIDLATFLHIEIQANKMLPVQIELNIEED